MDDTKQYVLYNKESYEDHTKTSKNDKNDKTTHHTITNFSSTEKSGSGNVYTHAVTSGRPTPLPINLLLTDMLMLCRVALATLILRELEKGDNSNTEPTRREDS